MSTSDHTQMINLTITKFPQNLLIPNADNIVSIQILSQSKKNETFKFSFEGENLEVIFEPKEFDAELEFKPGESKSVDLKLKPTGDGYGKLIINAFLMKIVKYAVKVHKLRDTLPSSNIKKILEGVQALTFDSGDNFKAKNFFVNSQKKNNIKSLENEIKSMRSEYEVYLQTQSQSERAISTLIPSKPGLSAENIESQLKMLAKQYLSANEFYKALETALKLYNETERIQFYYDLIRAYGTVDLNACLHMIKSIDNPISKIDIINKLVLDFVDINHDEIIKILSIIEEPSKKEESIAKVMGNVIKKDFQLALKLTYLIEDDLLKVKVLFGVAKELNKGKNKEDVLKIINQINQIIINSAKINLAEQDFQNPAFGYLKNAIYILAELNSPKAAEEIINKIKVENVRERVLKDTFDVIYILVEEYREKVEPTPIFSQLYLLNIFSSKIISEVQEFALMGGNISSNLLSQDYNCKLAILSLFSYDFSIFPIIDRIYSDLKFNANKSFAYYIFPSTKHHNEEELSVMQTTLRLFLPPNKVSDQILLFNLDFIPYLGKPTIILASESEDLSSLKAKVQKNLDNNVQVLIDNSLFSGGQTVTNLNSIFMSHYFKIVNLILSYEFLNDYNLFKGFIEAFS
ncbi:MAG: hypothetical protein ACFFFB_07180 [Candidatus Heimdallarchaeota archaeon]